MRVEPNARISDGPEEMQGALRCILESRTFARSSRLREFLLFVVKCAMENRAHEVNEYSLGVQVFGKSADYSPSQDNIVRVTARQLRTKLQEYYAGEGSRDAWRLEIPKGSYLPVLAPNAARESEESRRAPSALVLVLAVLCAAGWASAGWFWWRVPGPAPKRAYLLTSVLSDPSRTVTVVLDDPVLSRAWRAVGSVMPLDEFVAGRYLDEGYYRAPANEFLPSMLRKNYYVHYSTVKMLENLAAIGRSRGVDVFSAHSRMLKAESLKNGNLILIGGVASNPWVAEVQKHLAFEHRVDPRDALRSFINRSPRPGEPREFVSRYSDEDTRYYTRVAVLKNPLGSGLVALLGGTSRDATEAAGQFALSDAGVSQVSALCGAPAERLGAFEVILETKALAGTPMTRSIVAGRCGSQ
ncbi:MAG TPA: hypothetical protein VKX45_15780 [Bryobacteraceae bacterium]|nr:hypothetical protein [Bryobacteraceae bacterium]